MTKSSADQSARRFKERAKPSSELNWIDKAIWAMADFSSGETKYDFEIRYNVYAVMAGFAGSSFLITGMIYRFMWKVLGVIDVGLPDSWTALFLAYGLLGVVPIYLATHSAAEIATADLPERARRRYLALGFFICPISWLLFGLLLVWLE